MSLSAFIFGAGSRVGRSVALKLKAEGYEVAIGSRNPDVDQAKKDGLYPVQVDASKLETIQSAYDQVQSAIGIPNVVIFNLGALTFPTVPSDPLTVPLASFIADQSVGAHSLFALAQSAVAGFAQLPDSVPRVFIVTGNLLPFVEPVVPMMTLGLQKVADAYLVRLFNKAYYAKKGYRFYFAGQVSSKGGNPGDEMAGEAHAIAYWELIQRKELGNWDHRFIKDGSVYEGY